MSDKFINTDKLQARLRDLGISGEQLARQADLGRATVSRLLNDRIVPSLETLHAICRVTGLMLRDLLVEPEQPSTEEVPAQ